MKPVLVRDLALEHWPSMDRYAEALAARIPNAVVPDTWTMKGPRYLTRLWRYPQSLKRWHRAPTRGAPAPDIVHILDHSYAHCLKSFPGMPSVVTVHDLLPLRLLAEDQRTLRMRVRDRMLRWVLDWMERADRFIVSTEWTARELERYLDIPSSRVSVVPYGVDAYFHVQPPHGAAAGRRARWAKVTGANAALARVVLHVGSCAPRKNVEAVIGAVGQLRANGANVMMVQIGGAFAPHQRAAIAGAGLEKHIVQEPRVSEDDLVASYHAADVLAMPSTFEGFGLPAVEAMAAGLPVVTSGAGGLREAVADAALVTRATDAASLADGISAVLEDPVCRADLIARGKRRAKQLTWDRTARETQLVYDELLGVGGPVPGVGEMP